MTLSTCDICHAPNIPTQPLGRDPDGSPEASDACEACRTRLSAGPSLVCSETVGEDEGTRVRLSFAIKVF